MCRREYLSFPLEETLQDSFGEWVTLELPTQGWISRLWPPRKGTKKAFSSEKREEMHRGIRHPAGCEMLQGRDSVHLVHYYILCAKLVINKTNLIKQNNEWISSIWRVLRVHWVQKIWGMKTYCRNHFPKDVWGHFLGNRIYCYGICTSSCRQQRDTEGF